MKHFLFIILMLVVINSCFSQNNTDQIVENNEIQTNSFLSQADELPTVGTYQIMATNETFISDITNQILYQVNYKREVSNETTIVINANLKIRILPYDVIRSANFSPIKMYSYEN
jgi:hypothetical protein